MGFNVSTRLRDLTSRNCEMECTRRKDKTHQEVMVMSKDYDLSDTKYVKTKTEPCFVRPRDELVTGEI